MAVLSIQSQVVWGSVGNAIAVPTLYARGLDAWALNTVVFSNHPGHGTFTGRVTAPGDLRELVDGLDAHGKLAACDAILTGYLGAPETVEFVAETVDRARRIRPDVLYVCDPVMASPEKGLYVNPGIPPLMASLLVPRADVLTPNVAELGLLTGASMPAPDALAVHRALAHSLPRRQDGAHDGLLAITSVTPEPGRVGLLASTDGGETLQSVPIIPRHFNGAGDLFAALLCAALLRGAAPLDCCWKALSSTYEILRATGDAQEISIAATLRDGTGSDGRHEWFGGDI